MISRKLYRKFDKVAFYCGYRALIVSVTGRPRSADHCVSVLFQPGKGSLPLFRGHRDAEPCVAPAVLEQAHGTDPPPDPPAQE